MNWLFASISTALLWGIAELFYKKGAQPNEKYSHLKICVFVGVVMGAHAVFTLLTQDINYNPINLIRYLPVSLMYISSMAFSYFGMRFLEESISDPIENTAGVICALLFAIFLKESIAPLTWVAIAIITVLDDTIRNEDYILQNYDIPILSKIPDLSEEDTKNNYAYKTVYKLLNKK